MFLSTNSCIEPKSSGAFCASSMKVGIDKPLINESGLVLACATIKSVLREMISILGKICSIIVDFPHCLAPRIDTILLFEKDLIITSSSALL